mgnify:FL=1
MSTIKPTVKFVSWLITSAFLFFSVLLFLSPYFMVDWKVWSLAFLALSLGLALLWGLDYSHLTIKQDGDYLTFVGYFNGRKIRRKVKEIKGYRIEEKADQYSGHHEEYQLITQNDKVIRFPRIAYPNYEEIRTFCASNFEFLGHKPLKYAEIMGRLMPIIGFVSGVLALLVALKKFF